ncbi:uncharacterized protein LAESUDRAFT_150804 [Laetiporus sulphureus 93-53]|uniref:Uncharacterized protein n=1 Tax=Laetiporus sulphureus 93-53 TaxID=1314785 RepID=A0A165HHX2_9APHY|nr:uncharacterized protein LAESUDRAFT_150804 [Laetiporus sulphureus 93-53]KZT11754.1 hypothetical protein LAESUDRAFT_150804 [Laetiporus sulphureus 93-53]
MVHNHAPPRHPYSPYEATFRCEVQINIALKVCGHSSTASFMSASRNCSCYRILRRQQGGGGNKD